MRALAARLIIITVTSILITSTCLAGEFKAAQAFKNAYPDFIKEVNSDSLTWANGEHMNINDNTSGRTVDSPTLLEQLNQTNLSNK